MIRNARLQDRKTIYDLHSSNVTLGTDENMEFYFSQLFNENNIIVNEVNGHVEAAVQVNYHTLMFNDLRLSASVLLADIAGNQGERYLEDLLKDVSDEISRKTLVSLAITANGDRFAALGFEPIYKKRIYEIRKSNLANRSYQGCGKSFSVNDLISVYREFTSHFNGYYLRNNEYWLNLYTQLQASRYNIVVYRNSEEVPQGYMIYRITQTKVLVDELVYLNGEALIRLLCYGMRFKDVMEVRVSQSEDLSRAVPKIKCQVVPYIYARINNPDLFNRLFNSKIRNTRQGFGIGEKPLFINEKY